ncbi:hypothetical protein BDFB_012945 [Asbolus verrucosus]|uniref:Uncharacterized protein n=1 Tax=Asbolus verrucosus TaxID=1661398 RepID=A0A482VTF1_ASBVE|nr:hypothetical protein BDFB_012945 [Asbolus verrucosus]
MKLGLMSLYSTGIYLNHSKRLVDGLILFLWIILQIINCRYKPSLFGVEAHARSVPHLRRRIQSDTKWSSVYSDRHCLIRTS